MPRLLRVDLVKEDRTPQRLHSDAFVPTIQTHSLFNPFDIDRISSTDLNQSEMSRLATQLGRSELMLEGDFSASDEQSFQYTALQSPTHIRLIRLLASLDTAQSSKESTIRCTFCQLDLNDRSNDELRYTAVSYTWGDEPPSHIIMVDERTFVIRPILHDFVVAMIARKEFSRLFWIDQLCINQSDVVERNVQVQQMAEIFSSAECVYAWLGMADEHTAQAFRMWKACENIGKEVLERRRAVDPAKFRQQGSRAFNGKLIVKDLLAMRTLADRDALADLFSRRYWSRLWIVQEVFLAAQILFLCGSYEHQPVVSPPDSDGICLEMYSEVQRWLGWSGNPSDSSYSSFTILTLREERIVNLRDGLRGRVYLALDIVMLTLSGLNCADVRDKIYGLQGCLDPDERVTVDYRKTAEEVLRDQVEIMRRGIALTNEGEWLWSEVAKEREAMQLERWPKEKIISEYRLDVPNPDAYEEYRRYYPSTDEDDEDLSFCESFDDTFSSPTPPNSAQP